MRLEEFEGNFLPFFQNWTCHPIDAFLPCFVNSLLPLARLLDFRQSHTAEKDQLEKIRFSETDIVKHEKVFFLAREVDINFPRRATFVRIKPGLSILSQQVPLRLL